MGYMTYHDFGDFDEYREPEEEDGRSWDYDQSWDDYNSGPFCMHFHYPPDCDELCPTCGHPCNMHSAFVGCWADNCNCGAS
jgi:hypothetical protein